MLGQKASAGSLAKNRAFVFVKPHAVTDKVKDLVREQLTSKGFKIVQEGGIDAAAIDAGMLVDKHYYAIASKATLLKPDKLPVPADKFQDKFGVEWSQVLASGQALNAKDACERLRVDAAGLGSLWVNAKNENNLVKFSGGFYCAKIAHAQGTFYVFNGFFMEMRNKYVAEGASIHYYLVDWSPLDTPWEKFRGEVLGPTDPTTAPAESIRGQIFARWSELGLAAEPTIADNGVHASASPMEALFERLNWLGTSMEEDPFGSRLLQNQITLEMVEDWRRDPQITLGRGAEKKKVSLYDALEDLDVDRCITRAKDIVANGRTHAQVHKNRAFVFIKPHAVTPAVKDFVRQTFAEKKMKIVQEGVIEADQIDEDMLVDKHYYAIASKATLLTPDKLPVPQDKFQAKFGLEWSEALSSGRAVNAKDACDRFGVTAQGLSELWIKAKDEGKLVKFSGGFYCAQVDTDQGAFYVFNGFFMEMRNKFVKPGAEIYYFVVDWDPVQTSWSDFRGKVLGPTDPSAAPADSIRGTIYSKWQELGLAALPTISDNGVHASASPIEALFERMNWLGIALDRDPFGKLLLQGKVSREQVEEWSKDPQVIYGFGPTKGSFYDCLEDKDTDVCLEECLVISRVGHTPAVIRNSAFLFIKPHAITDATKDLVREHLSVTGLDVVKEGAISAATIDKDMLIDKHYYAIASKATLQTPDQLPVPEDKFQAAFGLSWQDALAGGTAVNAKQACEKMGLDAGGLNAKWSEAKKDSAFVKLGGGFYCAKMEHEGTAYYVFNGFFMEMRNKYVAPGAEIYYFLVEWDPLVLSWADFRGQLLGQTDPAQAPETSLRGKIFAQWQALGLGSEPDIANNGVHASASPFEALSERMNWVGATAESDAFGQLLLHSGVTKAHIQEWALDPRVTYLSAGEQVTTSLYDALEDLDADRCVTQCQIIVGDAAVVDADELKDEAAQELVNSGTTLHTTHTDGFDCYSFKYYVEDPNVSGRIWEVSRDQAKVGDEYSEKLVWSARKLTVAEVTQVREMAASSPKRSPLNNRTPGGA
eukprot:TRINITY_DN1762_c0_g1_i1.p1 TRINITY_DN1762_c0_g1~~TRINITY_DN1762_c0_g1_i1.p1  ORF type:complete len:1071 (-),score=302.69 TRINITY_DN1762_c0_g1_i1:230-3364(-)